jgi:hypothetical protein
MKKDYLYLCDNRYDKEFSNVNILGRYPWVGVSYHNSQYRPLIVGDSHYATDGNGNFCQEEYDNFVKNKESTRDIVNCVINNVCKGETTWSMFDGLLKTFIEFSPDYVKNFWSKVAFYNFIQEPMKSASAKPNSNDKEIGWRCLTEVAKIIHPTFILIVGVRNWYGMHVLDEMNLGHELTWDKDQIISRTTPAFGKIIYPDEEIPLAIIHHTSQGYDVNRWRTYLQLIAPNIVSYLE